jgi:lipoprotein-anchoring transpeptidase ErfK/SrfK
MPKQLRFLSTLLPLFLLSFTSAFAQQRSVVVSVPEQRLYVLEGNQALNSYKISTSQFGLGDALGSFATPLGMMEITGKVGSGAPVGCVFKGCRPTGEICRVNAYGRDPIVTRIIRLGGLEPSNASAAARGIYIHGTPEERRLGRPASYGCVRMRSRDVIELFNSVRVGTKVEIVNERVRSSQVAQGMTARGHTS